MAVREPTQVPMRPASEPVVCVRNLHKAFAVPRHRTWTFKDRLRHPLLSFRHDHVRALQDVSFDVTPGEFFAIVGRNGSGKSTLLRCIAGIHAPDAGEVKVGAPLAPFIELGVGFHPQLAARDNVVLAGTLMGLNPAEARRRVPAVISFAELEEFAEMPIGNYSSGMQVRLAFSTSFQVDADLLLFDEVLAVGDAIFRRRCLDTFERLIERGHTIVYVTHALDTVRQFADRVLLLERGRAIALGDPEEVLQEYERRNREHDRLQATRQAAGAARGGADTTEQLLEHMADRRRRATGLQRFGHIVLTLTRSEFKLRYLDSIIGYLWSLAQPLLMFLVLYFVWTQLFPPAIKGPHYQLGLLLGIAMYTFFSEATGHGLVSLVSKGTTLRKIPFPPLALPLSSVLTSCVVYGLTLVIVFGFIVSSGVAPALRWIEMVPVVLLLITFTTGVALVLSLLFVVIRDVQWIWVVAMRLLFFLTPIFYPIEQAPSRLRHWMMLNPLADVIVQARHALIEPAASTALGAAGPLSFAVALSLAVGPLAAGLLLYRRYGLSLAERI